MYNLKNNSFKDKHAKNIYSLNQKYKSKENYPNHVEQKLLYNDASNIFQQLVAHEENEDCR